MKLSNSLSQSHLLSKMKKSAREVVLREHLELFDFANDEIFNALISREKEQSTFIVESITSPQNLPDLTNCILPYEFL